MVLQATVPALIPAGAGRSGSTMMVT